MNSVPSEVWVPFPSGSMPRYLGPPAGQLTNAFYHDVGGFFLLVVAEHGDRPGVLIEAAGVGANDGLIHAAVMALVEVAEFIGQAVVANVTPTNCWRGTCRCRAQCRRPRPRCSYSTLRCGG